MDQMIASGFNRVFLGIETPGTGSLSTANKQGGLLKPHPSAPATKRSRRSAARFDELEHLGAESAGATFAIQRLQDQPGRRFDVPVFGILSGFVVEPFGFGQQLLALVGSAVAMAQRGEASRGLGERSAWQRRNRLEAVHGSCGGRQRMGLGENRRAGKEKSPSRAMEPRENGLRVRGGEIKFP